MPTHTAPEYGQPPRPRRLGRHPASLGDRRLERDFLTLPPPAAPSAPPAPLYWLDAAFDSRLPVALTNTSGADLHDHLVTVTLPLPLTIDAASLRVVETTPLASIDRTFDWRYAQGTGISLNHLPLLPATSTGGTVTFKVLGRWPTGTERTFGLYWSSTGSPVTPAYNHLGAIAPSWTTTITAGTTGDAYTLHIGGATYTHVMLAAQTAAQIGAALAALINAASIATATGTSTLTIKAIDPTLLSFTVANTGSTVPANLVVTKPLYWTVTRTGPDTAAFTPLTYAFGVPYGVGASVATRPSFGRSNTLAVRLGQYRVNGDATAYGALSGTPTAYTNNGPDLALQGAIAFDQRAGAVDWAATWSASHRQRILVGRKSDDTGPNTLNKYVDVLRVTLQYVCQRTYAPTTILPSVTTVSNFDLLTLGSTVNTFTSNVTESAPNRIANFSAPLSTGTMTAFGASADLSALSPTDTILGTHGNTNAAGLLVNSIQFTGWTANPTVKWAANSNPFAVLQLVNVSNAVSIPAGATITLDFWLAFGHTNSVTTVGDNLLPDELVSLMRSLGYAPAPVFAPAQSYAPLSLARTLSLAASRAVAGIQWFQTNATAYTTVAQSYAWARNIQTGAMNISDDDDGNYGEAHKLHGLCLRYLRTHDAALIPIIEAQVQYHIAIEAQAVAAYGAWWSGSAPYWWWPSTTSSGATYTLEGGIASGDTDPLFNAGVKGPITYTQGQIRRQTSIDQMHMVGHGLYAYLYLLRNQSAITANTTLRTSALALLSRMNTFEAAHFTVSARFIDNLYPVCATGNINAGTHANGITDTLLNSQSAAPLANPYYGETFGLWNVSNGDGAMLNASANLTIDYFFRAVFAPDSTQAGVIRFLTGQAMDILATDLGRHDIIRGPNNATNGVLQGYPAGWSARPAVPSNTTEYESTRTSPSNNGFTADKHLVQINSAGGRDHLSLRTAQRACCLAFLALLDPAITINTEMNGATPLRTVPILTAVDDIMRTAALYGIEPTTNAQRFAVAAHLGKTTTYDPQIVDSAFTGYWIMAVELWHLVQQRIAGTISVADYYRFSGV